MRMFQAAWPASQRPGARPTRGSGFGAVIETIGVTGAGITAGGGGGGAGRAPRAPWPPPGGAVSAGEAVCGVGACGAMAFGAGAPNGFFGANDATINKAAASDPETRVTAPH